MLSVLDSDHQQILDHLIKICGPVEPLSFQEILPVHDNVHVTVHVIKPNAKQPVLTLFTTGMSDSPMKSPPGKEGYQYAELIMNLPGEWKISPGEEMTEDWYWPVQRLRQTAYYPHQHDTWLGGPCSIVTPNDPPVPLGPQTSESCLLLMRSDNPLQLQSGKKVYFYTVSTLFAEERDFEQQHGIQSLLMRLFQHGWFAISGVPRQNVGLM
jgi:hypothetical protein